MAPTGFTRSDLIPNEPLREAFVASGMTAVEMCHHLGRGRRDSSRIRRQLGLMSSQASKRNGGGRELQSVMDRGCAIEMCRILEIDFDELYDGWLDEEKPAAYCETCGDPMLTEHITGQCGFCLAEAEMLGQGAVAA